MPPGDSVFAGKYIIIKLRIVNVSYTLIGKRQRCSVPYESLFNRKCPKALVIRRSILLCAPFGAPCTRAELCINFVFTHFT